MSGQPNPDWENIQGRRYPGYGRCIFCGCDGGVEGLRDEHIIPLALGGDTVIEHASCRTCERLISPVDTHLGHSVYGRHRIHVNAPTRHPKERPATLPARFTLRLAMLLGTFRLRTIRILSRSLYGVTLAFGGVRGSMSRSRKLSSTSTTGYHPISERPSISMPTRTFGSRNLVSFMFPSSLVGSLTLLIAIW